MAEAPWYHALLQRMDELENREITVDDLPLQDLRQAILLDQPQDPIEMLLPKSVTVDLLAPGAVGINASDETTLRVIRGSVDTTGSGSILTGLGFSIVRNGAGDVTVTFSVAFGSAPAVVLGMGSTAAAYWPKLNATFGEPTVSAFRAAVIDSAGALHDGIFHFIAIGRSS